MSTNGTGAPSSFLYTSSMRSTYPSLSTGGTTTTSSGPSSLTTTSASPGTGLSRLRRYGETKSEDLGDGKSGPPSLSTSLSYSSKYSSSLSDKLSLSSGYGGRITGLDRLAQRQKAFEQANGLENGNGVKADTNGTTITTTVPPSIIANVNNPATFSPSARRSSEPATKKWSVSVWKKQDDEMVQTVMYNHDNALASKREMFFKGETTSTTTTGTTPTAVQNGPSDKAAVLNHASSTEKGSSSILNHVTTTIPSTTSINSSKDSKIEYLRKESSAEKEDRSRDKIKENGVVHPPPTTNIIRPRRSKDVDANVGFANLPNQVYRKAVKKGFEFTLMVVGESGLGKSTLINSMFLADIYSNEHPGPSKRIKKTIQVETTKVLLKENAVNLTLTIVDTPGFGDAVDNSNCWQPVMDYIENKYDDYLNAESRVNRKPGLSDCRVHACVYFIAPSGHGLKPLDVEFMRRLHDKVNIIPVIAKADTMTQDECHLFKKQIMNEISQHKIKIYEFPDCDDEEDGKTHKSVRDRVPFAVVGSNCILEVDGRKVRGRRYPWGIVEVENLSHCDFLALRNMVIRTHMQDLKDVTNSIHYENFRCRKLAGLGQDGKMSKLPNKNPLAQMEEERKEHEAKMIKMEADMQQVFDLKVKEKRQKIKDSEGDMTKRHEQMTQTLERQEAELAEKRRQFENEVRKWEEANGLTLEELRRRNLECSSKETVDGRSKKKKGLF